MARIRTIKPDAFTSDSLSSVPRGTRWTFAGLWTYADDAGRGRDDVRLIKAALYPLDDDVTLEHVAEDLELLRSIGAICRYVVAERGYLHMPNWGHQKINRPTPAKSPPCPLHEGGESGHVLDCEDSLTTHGILTEPSTWERKGREGKGYTSSAAADGPTDTLDDDFAEWYAEYPRKVGKQAAIKAYRKARKIATAQQILDGLRRQSPKLAAAETRFRPHPATWLNEGRWEDEDGTAPQVDDDNPWGAPRTLPDAPPEIADDPARYAQWLDDWRREQNG